MGRSRSISDDQILKAAREVFLEEGPEASTLEIARRAGVSEGSIFKRFKTKENLFFAAMGISGVPNWVADLKTLVGNGDLKSNLITLSLEIVQFLNVMLPRLVMMRSKGDTAMQHFPGLDEPPIKRDINALAEFFNEEMRLGRMRSCDAEIVANALLGALSNHVLMTQILNPKASAEHDSVFVQRLVEFFWQGISPLS